MKKFAAVLLIAGSAVALSACGTSMGNVDSEPPYATDRTATHSGHVQMAPVRTQPVVRSERVFKRVQTK